MKKSQLIASLLLPAASIVVIASVGTAIAVDMSTSSKIKIATSDGKTSAQLGDGDSVIIKTDTTKLNGDVTWDFFDSDGTKLDTAPYIEVGTKNNSQIELTYHVANNTANSTNYTVQASINDTVSNSFKIDMMNLVSLNWDAGNNHLMDMGDSVALSANTNNPGSVTWSDLSGIPSGISISNINNKLTFTVTGAVSSPNLDFPIKANFYHTELSASLQWDVVNAIPVEYLDIDSTTSPTIHLKGLTAAAKPMDLSQYSQLTIPSNVTVIDGDDSPSTNEPWTGAFSQLKGASPGNEEGPSYNSCFQTGGSIETLNFATPSSTTSIEPYAFADCESLKNVTLPDSLRDLKYAAFFECDNLNTFNFGNGVQTIGEFALANPMSDPGTMLTSLVIPNSVNTIQFQAFNENSNLTSIEFLADTPPTFKDDTGSPGNSDLFNGCATTTNKITIIIPATATKSVWDAIPKAVWTSENSRMTIEIQQRTS